MINFGVFLHMYYVLRLHFGPRIWSVYGVITQMTPKKRERDATRHQKTQKDTKTPLKTRIHIKTAY